MYRKKARPAVSGYQQKADGHFHLGRLVSCLEAATFLALLLLQGTAATRMPHVELEGRLVILDMHVRQVWLLDTASAAASADTYGGSFSWSMRAPDGQQAGYVLPGPLVTDGGDPVSPTARVSLRCTVSEQDPYTCTAVSGVLQQHDAAFSGPTMATPRHGAGLATAGAPSSARVPAAAEPLSAGSTAARRAAQAAFLSALESTTSSATTASITYSQPVKPAVVVRLLVMVVSLEGGCTKAPAASVEAVREAYTREGGYFDFWRQCSYGWMVGDRATLKVAETPVQCSSLTLACNPWALAAAADKVAAQMLGRALQPYFNRFSYILPSGYGASCGWSGLGDIPVPYTIPGLAENFGKRTWYVADMGPEWGFWKRGFVFQELLHNAGLWHAHYQGVEYEDNSSCMGLGDVCPNAPELWRLGWALPRAVLRTSTLHTNRYRTFLLASTAAGRYGSFLRVLPDWLDRRAYVKNLYLSFRTARGADEQLAEEFREQLSIHEWDRAIDGDPAGYYGQYDSVNLLTVLPPFGAVDLSPYKLMIRTRNVVPPPSLPPQQRQQQDWMGSRLVVQVCRYDMGAEDCRW